MHFRISCSWSHSTRRLYSPLRLCQARWGLGKGAMGIPCLWDNARKGRKDTWPCFGKRRKRCPSVTTVGFSSLNTILFHASFNPQCCLGSILKHQLRHIIMGGSLNSEVCKRRKGTICFCNFLHCYWVLEGESNLVKRLIIIHVPLTITQ